VLPPYPQVVGNPDGAIGGDRMVSSTYVSGSGVVPLARVLS
jgi:hypothetical protein